MLTEETPRLSIIVPVYNVAAHVAACLYSLRAQTFGDFECLVIDDGSTDDSAAQAETAIEGDPRFQLIRQDNQGLSGARNTGLDRAVGDVIGFVDSDDRVSPDYLQRLWQALQDSGADWVACAIRFVHPDGTGQTHSAIHSAADLSQHSVARRYRFETWTDVIPHFPSAWNKLYRRSLIEGLRFDEGRWFEDHGFFHRAAARTDHLLHLPEALYLQSRDREGQITGADDDRVFDQLAVLDDLRSVITEAVRPEADRAFAALANRLLAERSGALRDPRRRARFAKESAAFLAAQGIPYRPNPTEGTWAHWGLEMAGQCPLAVQIVWDGAEPADLDRTLTSLSRAEMPQHALRIHCADAHAEAARAVLTPSGPTEAEVTSAAETDPMDGCYRLRLQAGETVTRNGVFHALEQMAQAQADIGLAHWTARPNGRPQAPDCETAPLPRETPAPVPKDQAATLICPDSAVLIDTRTHGWDRSVRDCLVASNAVMVLPVTMIETDVSSGPESRPAPPPDAQILFPTQGTGFLRLRAAFHEGGYANLFCMTQDGPSIPFHLSLRRKEQMLVWNTRDDTGTWGPERMVPLHLTPKGCFVTIRFADGLVRVCVDDQEVLQIGKRGFLGKISDGLPALDQIRRLQLEGDFRVIDCLPEDPSKALSLDPRLMLRITAPARKDTAGWRVRITAGDRTLYSALTPCAIGEAAQTLEADLPGHVWSQDPVPDALQLQVETSQGKRVGRPVSLDQSDLIQRLSALLDTDIPVADSRLILTLLGHLTTPNMFDRLTRDNRTKAVRLAQHYGLDSKLPPLPAPPRPGLDSRMLAVSEATARFAISQRQNPRPDPLEILDTLRLPDPEAQQALFLALSEVFCRHDQNTQGFIDRARALPRFTPKTDGWSNSAMLPFLVDQGDTDTLLQTVRGLIPLTPDWVLTPPLAWLARHAVWSTGLTSEVRRDVLLAILAFVDQRSQDYWERTQCSELIHAAGDMIAGQDRLAPEVADQIEDWSLRNFGLSRAFWQSLRARAIALPPKLGLAQRLHGDLQGAIQIADLPLIERCLDLFERFGCHDVPRWRLDHLGPAGAVLETQPVAQSLSRNPDSDLTALRFLAHPLTSEVAPDTAELAGKALRHLYWETERAPHLAAQQALSDAARTVLRTPTPEASAALIAAAAPVADGGSQWLGLGVLMSVVDHLEGPARDPVMAALHNTLAPLSEAERRSAADATPVRIATRHLRAESLDHLRTLLPLDPVGLAQNAQLDTDPVHDAIVVLFSCKPYLDDRLPALREGWLQDLDALGVPWVVVVGDGDGRQDGPVVHLDAPDDYEGLPLKTLATLRWVRDNTSAGHMIKIDDDCFLNADLFLRSLSWRKHDYYGRRLTREPGQMDRAWHQAKSRSERGRLHFDLSPEPSVYADGGTGYAVSRIGMDAALRAAEAPAGQRLIANSFMEDKLLGDLLALEGITVRDEDYHTSVWRRAGPESTPVPLWVNGMLPSRVMPVHLAHLDRATDQVRARETLHSDTVRPYKIWPSYQAPRLGYQTNTLELISSQTKVAAARDSVVSVVACMRNEMFMLPQFLAHYRALGVDSFLIADNTSDDGTLEYLEAQPDVAVFSVDTDYNQSRYGVAWQQALLSAVRVGRWSLVADADELLVWQSPQTQSLTDLLATPEIAEAEAVRVFMLDMYPKGPLEDARFQDASPFAEAGYADATPFLSQAAMRGPFNDADAWTSGLRHRLIPGSRPNLFTAQKLALLRYQPWMRLTAGMHFIGDVRCASRDLVFAHFKYNADFRRKAETEVARKQHWGNAEEYAKYLALASEGRSVVYDPDLSLPWTEVPFVQAVFAQHKAAT